jgi:predicted NBD/HSP70 family sugar kinase
VSRHLGLDLGGSSIKAVALERDGESYRELTSVVETRRDEPPVGIVAQLSEIGAAIAAEVGGVDTVGIAGELGHLTVDPSLDAPLCGRGNRGCVEAYVQASAWSEAGSPRRVT